MPLSVGKEGGDVAHDKAKGIEDDPGDNDALEPGAGFVYRAARAGEIHHHQGHRSRHDGGNGGDAENLGVDVLHHLAGLGPESIRRKSRLTEQRRQAGSKKTGVEGAPIVTALFLRSFRECGFSIQSMTSFFRGKRGQHPEYRALSFAAGHEKRRLFGVAPQSFSLVFTVLSILSLTHMDLQVNTKTLSIHSQTPINFLSPYGKMYP